MDLMIGLWCSGAQGRPFRTYLTNCLRSGALLQSRTLATGEAIIETALFQGSAEEWDGLVRRFDHGSFCHLSGWRSVMVEMGHDVYWWVALDDSGVPCGLLPLVRVRSRLFGDYLVSMPFLSYGGPIGSESARRALADRARTEAGRLGVDLLELRCRSRLPADLPVSDRKLTVLKPMPNTSDELWEKGLKSKVRSQVRRPMKAGFEARIGPELRDAFYDVYSRTMRDLGTPVLSKGFFESIARALGDEVVFATVDSSGGAIAAGCGFYWNGEFEITWAGALREFSKDAPNMLLYWSLMEETIRRGGQTFNFGRCSPGSGTHRFKSQWGAVDHPLPWAHWSPGQKAAPPNPDEGRYQLAIAAWRRLPLGVANLLGPRLSRWLP